MWKVSVTLLLAVVICLGWTAFNAAQAAPDQRVTQRTDAHYRGNVHNPARDYGYGAGGYPRPYPHRRYYPIRSPYPYPGYNNAHRPHPVNWLFVPPLPNPFHRHGGY
jgi:hypothetical protein